jgi:hypothetical protein
MKSKKASARVTAANQEIAGWSRQSIDEAQGVGNAAVENVAARQFETAQSDQGHTRRAVSSRG